MTGSYSEILERPLLKQGIAEADEEAEDEGKEEVSDLLKQSESCINMNAADPSFVWIFMYRFSIIKKLKVYMILGSHILGI